MAVEAALLGYLLAAPTAVVMVLGYLDDSYYGGYGSYNHPCKTSRHGNSRMEQRGGVEGEKMSKGEGRNTCAWWW